jgi:hypothetical protein
LWRKYTTRKAANNYPDGNLEFIDGDHGAVLGALRRPVKENDTAYLIFAKQQEP